MPPKPLILSNSLALLACSCVVFRSNLRSGLLHYSTKLTCVISNYVTLCIAQLIEDGRLVMAVNKEAV